MISFFDMVHKINCKIDPDGQVEMKRRNNSDAEYDKCLVHIYYGGM